MPIWSILIIWTIFYDFDALKALETNAFGDQISIKSNAIHSKLIFFNLTFRFNENAIFLVLKAKKS